MTITLAVVGMKDGSKKLKLVSPYHPGLPAKARALGGKFNADNKAWYFDPRDFIGVREMTQAIYGIDPMISPADTTMVTIRVTLGKDAVPAAGNQLFLVGRQVLARPGRDAHVRLGEGVVLIAGGFPYSGGSGHYPEIKPESGTVIEIRDVPEVAAAALVEQYPQAVEVVTDAPAPDPVAGTVEQILALVRSLSPERRAAVAAQIAAMDAR